jgi:predicted RNA-binding protein with PUA-like domain
MRKGDRIFFYHSSCDVPGVYGIAKVCREAYPDYTAQDPNSKYFDPKSTADNPRWFMVDVTLVKKLSHPLSLAKLKETPGLEDFRLLQKGNRLSVMPVDKVHWDLIMPLTR